MREHDICIPSAERDAVYIYNLDFKMLFSVQGSRSLVVPILQFTHHRLRSLTVLVELNEKKTKLRIFSPQATISTERPTLVGEVSANFYGWRMSRGQRNGSPRPLISIFYTRSRYFSIQVAPQLSLRGLVDPVPDPPLLRKCSSAGNRTRDLWIYSQELWPLDHKGGIYLPSHSFLHNFLIVLPSYRFPTSFQ
jgi:hypothetical protein